MESSYHIYRLRKTLEITRNTAILTEKITEVKIYLRKILTESERRNLFIFRLDLYILFNLIPHSPYSFDKFRISVGVVEFIPQTADMRHYGVIVVQKFFTPDILKQLFR